jgi:hypothetical protein
MVAFHMALDLQTHDIVCPTSETDPRTVIGRQSILQWCFLHAISSRTHIASFIPPRELSSC